MGENAEKENLKQANIKPEKHLIVYRKLNKKKLRAFFLSLRHIPSLTLQHTEHSVSVLVPDFSSSEGHWPHSLAFSEL